jgi:multiple sugar transport system substrate-binding protein
MKKYFAGMAATIVLASTVTACSTQEAGNANTASTGAANTTNASKKNVSLKLTMWGDDARKKQFEELFDKYKETHPNVSVEVLLIPFDDYQQKLSIMSASRTGPDITWLAERMIPQFIDTDQLLDLSSFQSDAAYDLKDIFPTTMDAYRKDNKLYGITFSSGPKVLYYNKSLFKEKGLKTPLELFKEGKWTYDEFYKTAKALTDPSKGVYGVSMFASNSSWKNWQDAFIDTIWANGAELLSADGKKFLLNSPEGEQSLKTFSDMMFKDQSHVKPGDQATFESGKLGMVRNTFSYVPTARKITNFDWDIAPMPKGSRKDAPSAVGVAGYSVMKDTQNPAEAIELVKYLTSREGMTLVQKSFAPTRKSLLESDAFLKADPKPSAEAIKAAYIDPLNTGVRVQPTHPNWQQIDIKIQTVLDLLYLNTNTPKQVLERMEKEVTPLLK